MLLDAKDVVAGYGSSQVLRGVSLTVEQGEIVTILGANGAGKTTLVKAIISLVKVLDGRIEFGGERIDGLPCYEIIKRGISVCPEGGQCFPDMSVSKNLFMGAVLLKDKSRTESTLNSVIKLFPVLAKRKTQKAGSLSGGERQMLAIGRALMGRPKLVIMDEPSMGLAPLVVNEIFEIIGSLRDHGVTILLVEQNASKSLKIADRGYVMSVGKIPISGTTKELSKDDHVKKTYLGM